MKKAPFFYGQTTSDDSGRRTNGAHIILSET